MNEKNMEYLRKKATENQEQGIIRRHYRFTGHVQGVGFRYRAKYIAAGLGLTGWVKNEWDGSVEMEVQGTESQINRMLKMLNESRFIQIDWIEHTDLPVETHDTGFHVR